MATISPIPTTRASDLLIRHRLERQLAYDQLALVRLQTALGTGRRISVPSEDAPSALRAISLQGLLERKEQVRANLATNQAFLNATDTALGGVANLLAQVRGTALGVIDSISTDEQRAAAAQEVEHAIEQLLDVGNQSFRDRHLFAGSKTVVRPFQFAGEAIRYNGDSRHIASYSDIDVLFDTNLHGQEVFGVISQPVRGTTDLDPIVSEQTRLADLRGGQGISRGSIAVSDGVYTSIVDISRAETLGDVVRLLEASAPGNPAGVPPVVRSLSARITLTGLELQLDGGNLSISEIAGGTTAAELGILNRTGVGTEPLVGSDLNRRLTLTTSLDHILGTQATASVSPFGERNNLIFTAASRGSQFNDVTIQFVGGGTKGAETAVYDDSDPLNKTLTITIEDDVSTANDVIRAVDAEGTFRASLDTAEANNNGTGIIAIELPPVTGTSAGGSEFDRASGLQITNGGETIVLDISAAETIEDVLNILNGAGAGVLAEINESASGIDVRSVLSGSDFTIGENGGTTAGELGIRSFTPATRLDELNFGRGVQLVEGDEFIIRRQDGVEVAIDISSAKTIGDVIELINSAPLNDPLNLNPLTKATARLAAFGNGIEIVSSDPAPVAELAVLRTNQSLAAIDLGLVADGEDASAPAVVSGATRTITGRDVNAQEVSGVFNALIRLRDALNANDLREAGRAIEQLDEAALDLNFARAELGARQRGLDVLASRLESEEIELQSALSLEIDTDLVAAISEFQARQAAMQASLQTAAQLFRFSLLDFL